MIHVVDYGLGNVQAFVNIYKRLGIDAVTAKGSEDLRNVTHLILPGVGSFDYAMSLLSASGMKDRLEELVLVEKIPVLGICVGMQMLAERSDEGISEGLGWIKGSVHNFSVTEKSSVLPLPHMGWNDVIPTAKQPLFVGIEENARFYFLHSYYFDAVNQSNVAAKAEYGITFDCAVNDNNVFGVQFHPEKSHHWGAALLKNFAELELC
jgi:glutamine amidotransferase